MEALRNDLKKIIKSLKVILSMLTTPANINNNFSNNYLLIFHQLCGMCVYVTFVVIVIIINTRQSSNPYAII